MDAVRALACLLIVNYHTKKLNIPLFEKAAVGGFVMNVVFLALSGYLLALGKSSTGTVDWYARRLKRILIPFLLACAAIAGLQTVLGKPPALATLPAYLTGLHYFFGVETLGEHLWFVSVLLVCYAVFPLAQRAPRLSLAGAISITAFLCFESNVSTIYSRISLEPALRASFHLAVFVAGIVAARRPIKLPSQRSLFGPLLLISFGPAYVFTLEHDNIATVLAALVCAFAFILTFRQLPQPLSPAALFVAAISYEIYLIHFVVIDAADLLDLKYGALPFVFGLSLALACLLNRAPTALLRQFQRCLATPDEAASKSPKTDALH